MRTTTCWILCLCWLLLPSGGSGRGHRWRNVRIGALLKKKASSSKNISHKVAPRSRHHSFNDYAGVGLLMDIDRPYDSHDDKGRKPLPEKGKKTRQTFGLCILDTMTGGKNGYQVNQVISPSSALTALGMALVGSSISEKREVFNELVGNDSINFPTDSLGIKTANRVYLNYQLRAKIKKSYRSELMSRFGGKIKILDFKRSERAARLVSRWVLAQTDELIPDAVSPDIFQNPTMQLVIVSASAFKGIWRHQFPVEDTFHEPFYVSTDRAVNVSMMNLVDKPLHVIRQYADLDRTTVLALPYVGTDLHMVFIMPQSATKDSMEYCIKYLYYDSKALSKLLKKLFRKKRSSISLSLPKFQVESNLNMLPWLSKAGVPELEAPGILKSGRSLRVGDLRQKAYITVNERGTDVAAVSAVTLEGRMGGRDALPDNYVTINKPFIYMIVSKKTKDVYFLGLLHNPILKTNGWKI